MRSDKRSTPGPTLIAFLFNDIGQNIQVLHLSPDYQVESTRTGRFVLSRRDFTLPQDFFGPTISSITALIGKNSSGKSTALADIARVLCDNHPVTSGCSLIVEQNGRICQLQHGWQTRISFNGADIPIEDSGNFENLKVVYFSSSYDPLQRSGALVDTASPVKFVDISSQHVYSRDNRRGDDFDEKLLYLNTIFRDGSEPLELKAEGSRLRSISFTARVAYEPASSARDFLKILLETLPRSKFLEHLKESLHAAIRIPVNEFERAVSHAREAPGAVKSVLWNRPIDYFGVLQDFFMRSIGQRPWTTDPVMLLMVIGRLSGLIADDRRRKKPHGTISKLPGLFSEPDAAFGELLGEDFISCADKITGHAKVDWKMDRPYFVVGARSRPGDMGQAGPGIDYGDRELLDAFIALRHKGVEFDIDFNGLSDGQRSLLSFAARYFSQENQEAWPGNTLLLIDEHEQGLHPEWQRRFVKELCELLTTRNRTGGSTQVVLSSHSPFLVADLPNSCVSIVGGHAAVDEPTFGGNLLELLLSPLFMDRTTGEFAAEKIKGWLDSIKRSRSPEKLKAMEPLIDLVGDTLMRKYLRLALDERLARLGQQTGGNRD